MKENIQKTIVGFLDAAFKTEFPDIPITYENQPFDWGNPPALFVEAEVKFYGGHQINLGSPKTRHSGYVYVTVRAKEGTGTIKSKRVLDWVDQHLGYKNLSGIQLEAPQPVDDGPVRGWCTEGTKFFFQADEA